MSKPRKMLCDLEAPYTQSLMRLIETQKQSHARQLGVGLRRAPLPSNLRCAFPAGSRPGKRSPLRGTGWQAASSCPR